MEIRIKTIGQQEQEYIEMYSVTGGVPKYIESFGAEKDIYTALFAVDKIQTLMDYYHAFKEKNDKGYRICAIFTFQPNEDLSEGQDEHSARYLQECMDDYNAMFGTHYGIDNIQAY